MVHAQFADCRKRFAYTIRKWFIVHLVFFTIRIVLHASIQFPSHSTIPTHKTNNQKQKQRRDPRPMGLHRVLNPELVLCSSCRSRDDNESRWRAYASDRDGSVLVRDVCAAQACPGLQVRGHLCVDHVLQAELAWQRYFPLRACNFCCRDVMQLYSAQQEVWFICPANESTEQARGTEKTGAQALKGRRRKSRTKGRNSRKARANKLKERLLALDWSIGNIPIKPMFLWTDNRRRLDAEAERARKETHANDTESESECESAPPPPTPRYAYPDPSGVFCVVKGCRHFAKTGDSCRFHSNQSAAFFQLARPSEAATAAPTRS